MLFDFFNWNLSNILIYLLGAIIEILGFALLFNKNLSRINFLKKNHILIGIILVIIGYVIAIGARGNVC